MMRGYEKRVLTCNEKGAFVSLALHKATRYENCEYKANGLHVAGGALPYPVGGKTAYLASNLPFPHQFFAIPNKTGEAGFGYISENGHFLRWDKSASAFVGVHIFGVPMRAIHAFDLQGNARLIFIGNGGVYEYTTEGKMITLTGLTDAPDDIACVCKDRVFYAIKPYKIVYSAPLVPTQYTDTAEESGRISFPSGKGEIVALVPHGKGVAIFYDYGVAVLETDGSARDFVWKDVAYGGGRIVPNSAGNAGVGGEKTFFLAEDGAYVLDGNAVRKVCAELPIKPKATGQVCEHAESGGKYYAVYENDSGEREGVAIDTQAETGCFMFAPYGLSTCNGVAVCMTDGWRVSELGEGTLPSSASAQAFFQNLDFGYAGRKTLRMLKVYGEGVLQMEIGQGDKSKHFTLDLSRGEAVALVRLRGERFSVRCTFTSGCKLFGLVSEWRAFQGLRKEGL